MMNPITLSASVFAITALSGAALAGGGVMINLPSNHLPLSCSADGSIVVGTVGDSFWRWTADSGVVNLGPFGNAGNPVVSSDGAVIAGTGLNPKSGKNEAALWDEGGWDLLGTLGFSCDASASSGC